MSSSAIALTQHSLYRAQLAPVPEEHSRPLWSVMIPTFNCSNYLRETLLSVLEQDPGPEIMQIEVVDDCSTADDPESVVHELGRGRVLFYRQPHNVGHVQNFQTCLQRSCGKIIHLLHGDDFVRPGFYAKLQQAFEQRPDLGAAFCRHVFLNTTEKTQILSGLERSGSGVLSNWLARIAVEQLIQTPSIVVRRDVYERLGMFDSRLTWCEDWEMWVRIAAAYPVWFEVEPLAVYRMHAASSTGRHLRTAENMRDVRRAITILQSYIPEPSARTIAKRSRQVWALKSIRHTVPSMIAAGDWTASMAQIMESLKFSFSWPVLRSLLPLVPALGRLLIQQRGA